MDREEGPLERTLRRLGRARADRRAQSEPLGHLSPWQFRALADERLRNLERQIEELKTRVNGLLFLLAGAVATQVLLRLLE